MADYEALNPMQGVSGPSIFSKRVDLEYKPDAYGEGVQYAADKAGAPLSKAPAVPGMERTTLDVTPTATAAQPIGLFDKSQRSDLPITDGIDYGPGRGSEAMGVQPTGKISEALAALLPYDTTGEITILYQNAISRGQ